MINCGQGKHADQLNQTMKEIINYISSKITDGEMIAYSLRTERLVVITCPTAPGDPTDLVEMVIFNAEIKAFISEKRKYETNIPQAFSNMIGQCTKRLSTIKMQ